MFMAVVSGEIVETGDDTFCVFPRGTEAAPWGAFVAATVVLPAPFGLPRYRFMQTCSV